MEAEQIKKIIEAAILVAEGPLDREAILSLFDEEDRPSKQDLGKYLEDIDAAYADRGIFLKEVASGFRFQARPELGQWVSRLWQEKPPRYSRAILETLALIAYRQPITRGEIEEIRGVATNPNIVRSLFERGWIREVGVREVPGRPTLLGTTSQFLDDFNLKALSQLPSLPEIKDPEQLEAALMRLGAGRDAEQAAGAVKSLADEQAQDSEAAETDEAVEPASIAASAALPAEEAGEHSSAGDEPGDQPLRNRE